MKFSGRSFLLLSALILVAIGVYLYGKESSRGDINLLLFPGLKKLVLPSSTSKIDWLKNSGLTHLDISNAQLADIEDVPVRLTALRAHDLVLSRLDLSESKLTYLDLSGTQIDGKVTLPPGLASLTVEGPVLRTISFMPGSLRRLTVRRADLSQFREIQRGIENLTLEEPLGGMWTPEFPASLRCLAIKNDSLDVPPSIPLSTVGLSLERTNPTLGVLSVTAPSQIGKLRVHGARITNWGEVAQTLTDLDLSNGAYPEPLKVGLSSLRLVALDTQTLLVRSWPSRLRRIALENFSTGVAPAFPPTIEEAVLDNTKIVDLSQIFARAGNVKLLSLENWTVVDLAHIPASVEALNLSGVQKIENLGKWPPNLRSLICERCREQALLKSLANSNLTDLDIDESRGITDVPALPNLRRFSARRSDIREIDRNLLSQLVELDVCGSGVVDLSELSQNLRSLALTPEQLSSVPKLAGLDSLVVRDRSECIDSRYSGWEEGRIDCFSEYGE